MKYGWFLLIFTSVLLFSNSFAQFVYKPTPGDKFTYYISKNNKITETAFIFDLLNNSSIFYWKTNSENPLWGNLIPNNKNLTNISSNLFDSAKNTDCNLIYLNKETFKLFKSKKQISVVIDGKKIELKPGKTKDYKLPVKGASFEFKLITLHSSDKRFSLSFIDNPDFAVIVSLIADAAWQLQSIVPLPMYPITFDITGKTIHDKSLSFFNNYISGTCSNIKAEYLENYKNIVFDEYFCPIAGIRFTLKNDTIISVVLQSKNSNDDGYNWKGYKGFFWGVYRLGTSKEILDKQLGSADKFENGKYYYRDRGFYLVFNKKNELEVVEYE